MPRTIILPPELEQRLDDLAGLVQEVNGILFYRRQKDLCPIEQILITGSGTEGDVQTTDERIKVANEFFRRNPRYRPVEFHTHTKGTIRRFGDWYASNFSNDDIATVTAKLNEDPHYLALLVTPTKKLVASGDQSILRVETFPEYEKKGEVVRNALRKIAANLGCDISRLNAYR